jgi:nicotinamide riboside kinase
VLTAIWSDTLTGERDPWFAHFQDYPDLYLFCDIDIPWVDDGTRYFSDPADRRRFHQACERELVERKVSFVRISGDRDERLRSAVEAVTPLVVSDRS